MPIAYGLLLSFIIYRAVALCVYLAPYLLVANPFTTSLKKDLKKKATELKR
jgi:hypothetical protein